MNLFLQAFGYDTDWSLPKTQTINPAHCSEYFERLIAERQQEQKDAVARIMAMAAPQTS